MNLNVASKTFAAAALLAVMSGCGGGSSGDRLLPRGGAILSNVEYGRLVDIYAYRRIDPVRDDRRDTANRAPVLIARNVVVRPDIETQSLFDSFGNARLDADYRFQPFDVEVGHPELVILWDDTIPPEKASFEAALNRATRSLPVIPGAFRGQNTAKVPMPVVPRNAAIRLNFDRDLGVGDEFFRANPNAIQLLEFINPLGAANRRDSFRPVPIRVLANGNRLVLDTSLIGGESNGGQNTPGMPPSLDNRTANIRIAMPTAGVVSKQIEFAEDPIAEFNGLDSRGDRAVIRDFRSGNLKDGAVGALADTESPMIVTHLKMGITDIDVANRVLTINKRNHDVAIRGRIPYVDGALHPTKGIAQGPVALPVDSPLRSGDVIMQSIQSTNGEFVTIRAEVVMNLDVGNVVDDPSFEGLGMYRKGSDPTKPADGGQDTFVHVKVTKLSARDSQGNEVTFRLNNTPLGEDCEVRVHYYNNVPYLGQYAGALTKVSDSGRVHSFLVVDPVPPVLGPNRTVNFGQLVDPGAAIALRFSEPMDIETVEPFENYMLTNQTIRGQDILNLIDQPKPLALALIATRLLDQAGDGTVLQLRPPLGHYHKNGQEEDYWFHLLLGSRAPTDMAGNAVDLFDRTTAPVKSLSVKYTLDKDAPSNSVGYRVFRFASQDEDGTPPGSIDAFGQFQLLDGSLRALPVSRFSAVADAQIMAGITRFDRGECDLEGDPAAMPPTVASIAPFPPGGIPGVLYSCPMMIATQFPPLIPLTFQPPNAPQTRGGVSEPHNQRGSRLQMTYREDDFGLAYHDPTRHLLDIEQMHWAPFNDEAIRFDVFDRYTLRLAHSDWRPELTFFEFGGFCVHDCFSGRSGLQTRFDDNVLVGSQYVTVLKNKVYEINPNDAFRASTGTKFVPYPQFDKTYTWRDPRLVTWDMNNDSAIGLGGAHQPAAQVAIRDTTASISSPYVPNKLESAPPVRNFAALHQNTEFVFDYGDFEGFRTRDHDPIALPLLMDFNVFPDGPANGGAALGTNQFQIALVGPCWTPISPGGYYNGTPLPGCGGQIPWPEMRAHASGGIDQITNDDILIEPEVQQNAQASVIKDIFFGDLIKGLYKAPPKDDHVHWAQADFVRRVSMVTYGFWDTLRPNMHDFQNPRNPLPPSISWLGRTDPDGTPNLVPDGDGIKDLVTLMDPPISRQPVGTSIVTEWRGARTFRENDTPGPPPPLAIFNQSDDDDTTLNWNTITLVKRRGLLLNPFYSCEAYRYAMSAEFDTQTAYQAAHTANIPAGPRVPAGGLTPYVTEDTVDQIRHPVTGLLPRYMNFRIVMENNLGASPPVSPSLKSFAIAYRVAPN